MHIVYGGAFNPPTLGHFNIVKTLKEIYPKSNIIILPVGNNYNKKDLIDYKIRKEMLELTFEKLDVIISDLEYYSPFEGTLSSLDKLSKEYSDIHLVIGSDHIDSLDKWIRYEELLSKYPLIIMNRNNKDIAKEMKKYDRLKVNYQIVEFNHPAKSTLIRNDLEKHKNWLNPDVYNYIIKNNLYEVKSDV